MPGGRAYWTITRAFEAALKTNKAQGAIVSSLPENLPEEYAARLVTRGIVPLFGIPEAMEAAQAAAFIGSAWRSATPEPIDSSSAVVPGNGRVTLDEAEAKNRLIKTGLPVPKGERASSAAEAVFSSMSLGFPVALKALGVAHKSEVGAVRLNLKDPDAVREAAHDLLPLGTGLYVERMIREGIAELIVGFARDPMFGHTRTLGSGGVLVELMRDSVTLMLPATRDDIEAALRGLKFYPLLEGYRGKPKADLMALFDVIAAIAGFVQKNASEID